MRFNIVIFYILLSTFAFAQNYGYDKKYQKQLSESGVEINEEQKKKVREDIKKYANFYLDKHYKYNEKAELTIQSLKKKRILILTARVL
mgnify:CR=1 FL=1